MGCEAQSAAIPVGIASICNAADRPKPGCAGHDRVVQRFPCLDNTKSQPVTAGAPLASFKASDYNTISTNASQTATLQFATDSSILRLDQNTRIKLVA